MTLMRPSFFLVASLLCATATGLAPVSSSRVARSTAVPRALSPYAKVAAAMAAFSPLAALAEEEYEYGAVDAPAWVLPVGALLVIATALLPLALRAGDDAQREMAERDSDSFGKKGKSPLDKKK